MKNIHINKENRILTEIGVYNNQVKDYIKSKPLTPIQRHAIKIFKDSAQRRKLSINSYNQEVTEFNEKHGLLICKKGQELEGEIYYDYINYPYISKDAIAQAMNNFRAFIPKYKKYASTVNLEVKEYNSTNVKNYHRLTETEKEEIKAFKKKHSSLHTLEFNKLVEQENETKNIHPKRKLKLLQNQYTDTFYVLLCFYASQLKKRNGRLMEFGNSTTVKKKDLPKLAINHRDLIDLAVDGVKRVHLCKRTLHNHTRIFVEAGIFTNKNFYASDRPIYVNINPVFLKILDGNPPKSRTPEKPKENTKKKQAVQQLKDTTRTSLIENDNIEGCAKSTENKCGSGAEENAKIYKSTNPIINSKDISRAEAKKLLKNFNNKAEKFNKSATITKNFLKRYTPEKQLAKELNQKEHLKHKPLRFDQVQRVLQYADVSKEQICKILIQDFLKTASKIWKDQDIYEGEWKNTINLLYTNFFKNLTKKEEILPKFKEYRWKINLARNWFENNSNNPLVPTWYFDVNRKSTKEIGFYGLHKFYMDHIKYLKQSESKRKEMKLKANKRKRYITNNENYAKAISKYFLGEWTYREACHYVKAQLPNKLLIQFKNKAQNFQNE